MGRDRDLAADSGQVINCLAIVFLYANAELYIVYNLRLELCLIDKSKNLPPFLFE